MRNGRALKVALFSFGLVLSGHPLAGQTSKEGVTRAYGRSVVEVGTARAQPGGVLGVTVKNARWSSASTLLDGHRGALSRRTGPLFGIVPLALDTAAGDHNLSLYFPGGRRTGGSTTVVVPVVSISRVGRARTLSPEAQTAARSQAALGHGRFLLAIIRTRSAQSYQTGPLRPPVDQPISFPFGGIEDYGVEMGPIKDGMIGEHHRGVDYAAPSGTAVKAPGSGVVVLARSLAFSGETLAINHGNGMISVLSHLTHVGVREGEMVSEGAVVGTTGQTGFGALTPHLCFSVYVHASNVDPEAVMDARVWP